MKYGCLEKLYKINHTVDVVFVLLDVYLEHEKAKQFMNKRRDISQCSWSNKLILML